MMLQLTDIELFTLKLALRAYVRDQETMIEDIKASAQKAGVVYVDRDDDLADLRAVSALLSRVENA